MERDSRAYLWDIEDAVAAIQAFVANKRFEDYARDLMLRPAVERQFEILGEALNQLSKVDPSLASRIPDAAQIVAFRNLLIHGYAHINDAMVWKTIQDSLPGSSGRRRQRSERIGTALRQATVA